MKRALDIFVSAVAVIALLPVALPICLILRICGEKRAFFRQERLGHAGRTFYLLKFTTMMDSVADRDNGGLALDSDPEVFPFGRLLRRTKLNEVPQLFNVLKGDMSLVGPRPLTIKSFSKFAPEVQEALSNVKPGLTGIGAIVFRDEEVILARSQLDRRECYAREILPYKGELERWYVENRSAWLDLKILIATAWVVVFPKSGRYWKWFSGLPEPGASQPLDEA